MIAEVESGNVGAVIIKDMSRLGRDYLQVGLYTEVLFREKHVHFIAVNDNVDSAKGEDDFTPFRNIINQWYARDTSRKIKASSHAKGMEGKHLTPHPVYGYLCDPDNKEQWIIDPEAATVVKRIYQLTLGSKGPYEIATILEKDKVFTPAYHFAQKGIGSSKNKVFKDPYRWVGSTIKEIIARKEYLGHTVNFKTFKDSYRDKNSQKAPIEKQVVFENTHEAIIELETWELAQRLRKTIRRPDSLGTANRLTGLLFCADCGAKLYNTRSANRGKPQSSYICSTYNKHTSDCTVHYIRTDVLESLILDALRSISGMVKENESEFVKALQETSQTQQKEMLKISKKRISENEKRIAEVNGIIRKLYEDYLSETLTKKRFELLTTDYEAEQELLEQQNAELKSELDRLLQQERNVDGFLELVKRYTDFTELTTPMLNEFV